MTEQQTLRDKVAKVLEDLIPVAAPVDFGDVAKRVIEVVRTHDAPRAND